MVWEKQEVSRRLNWAKRCWFLQQFFFELCEQLRCRDWKWFFSFFTIFDIRLVQEVITIFWVLLFYQFGSNPHKIHFHPKKLKLILSRPISGHKLTEGPGSHSSLICDWTIYLQYYLYICLFNCFYFHFPIYATNHEMINLLYNIAYYIRIQAKKFSKLQFGKNKVLIIY